jgi:uncharacterized protein YdeI (YjbR/CyaY-like superfamily)
MEAELEGAIYFKDNFGWRSWLEKYHGSKNEVWLIHYKKHSGKIGLKYDDAVNEAICFGWIDGKLKSIDEDRFMLRYSPRKSKSVWSKINKEKALRLITEGRMHSTGLARIEDAKKNGYWDIAYTNKKQEEVPSDLTKALNKDQIARYNFYNFANSYRNNYIGWIVNAKTDLTRRRRILEVVERSHINRKPGT